jgi:hypothetical protein
MEPQGRQRPVWAIAHVAPGSRGNLRVGQLRKGRYQVKRSDGPRSLDLNFVRQDVAARAFTLDAALDWFGGLLAISVVLVMFATCVLGDRNRTSVLESSMRVVPAASKHRVDEQHCGGQAG